MLPASTRDIVRYIPSEFTEAGRLAIEARLQASDNDSERDRIRAELSALEAVAEPPTYLVGVASVWGRQEIKRLTIAAGARLVSRLEILEALEDATNQIVAEHQRADVLAMIGRYRDLDIEGGEKPDDDDAAAMRQLTTAAHQHFPPYASLLALSSTWWPTLQYIAARQMLKGWEQVVDAEGAAIPFQTRLGVVTDDCLNLIPSRHLEEIGAKAIAMMTVTDAEKKSSRSP